MWRFAENTSEKEVAIMAQEAKCLWNTNTPTIAGFTTEDVLEDLAKELRFSAWATRATLKLKKRKAEREAEEVRAATMDVWAARVEAALAGVKADDPEADCGDREEAPALCECGRPELECRSYEDDSAGHGDTQ